MQPSPRQVVRVEESRRAARLRDNKRRNRQRQKEYTSSLEAKLRELQSQGVQATREVQVSARKVVEDNARLKALLRHVGVEDHVIETWTPDSTDQSPPVFSGCDRKGAGECTRKNGQHDISSADISTQHREPTELHAERKLPSEKLQTKCSDQRAEKIAVSESIAKNKPITLTLAPCKVLTRLAKGPGADITQPVASKENAEEQEDGGIECSNAHAMLMQFATTDEKLEVVSQAPERGCVGKKGGGCRVRNEVIWQAIDEVT